MDWSDEWEYQGTTFVRCNACGKAMPVEFKEKHKCKEKQKEVNEFKPATGSLSSIEQDIELFNTIRELLESKLGRQLEGEEHGWVSTIYIQRKRSM